MAVAIGTMARLKNGGAWSFFLGGPETAVEAFGPGVEIQIVPVGEFFELQTLAAVSAPTIEQPDMIVVPFGTGFTDNMAARVSGGVPPYTFSQVQAAPLPLGVTITAGGNLTGSNQFPVGGYGWSVRVTDSRVTNGEDDPQSATINYLLTVEALPQFAPSWVVNPNGTASIKDLTPQSGIISFELTQPEIYAGTYTVDSSQLAAGPVNLVPPQVVEATDNPGWLVMIPGLWLSLSDQVTISSGWLRDGTAISAPDISFGGYPAYEKDLAADAGKNIAPQELAMDANGARPATGAAYLVPVPVAGPLIYHDFRPEPARADIAGLPISTGGTIQKRSATGAVQIISLSGVGSLRTGGDGAVYTLGQSLGVDQYAEALWQKTSSWPGVNILLCVDETGANFYRARTDAGNLSISKRLNGVTTTVSTIYNYSSIPLNAQVLLRMEKTTNGLIRILFDGVQVLSYTDPSPHSGGFVGVQSVGTSNGENRILTFAGGNL